MDVEKLTAAPYRAFFVTGGTIPAESASYVERSADRDLLNHLLAGRFCYVLNSRQMGKSSLCVRTMKRLDAEGVRTAFVDLTRIGGKNVTPEQWYAGIAVEIGRSLGLRAEILENWKQNAHLSPLQRLFASLREVVLEQFDGNVAIFFDEIDATRSLPFSADEFFAGIRECYNRRVQDTTYDRLTFCLLGVAVPSDLINSPTSTPFNIGERIYLRDFTRDEAMALAPGLVGGPAFALEAKNEQGEGSRPVTESALMGRIYHWTNGHPYLTQSLCAAVAGQRISTPDEVDALVRRDLFDPKARETNINLADVANRAIHAGDLEPDPEKFRADLLSAYEKAWRGKPLADDESNRVAALLKLSGIMRSEGNRLTVRNRIYRQVFDKGWVRDNMPGQELRRQKRAFWLGVARTTAIAAVILTIIGALAWNNARLRREADEARNGAEYEAYIADVNLMKSAYDSNDLSLLGRLLSDTKNSRYRGMEWTYWNTAMHDAPRSISFPPRVGTVVMAADGHSVGIQNGDDNSCQVRSLPDFRLLHTIPPSPRTLQYLDGRYVLMDQRHTRDVVVDDALSGRRLFSIAPGKGAIEYITTSCNGGVAVGRWTRDGEPFSRDVTVWDGRTGAPIHRFRVESDARINSEAVSDDGRILVIERVRARAASAVENYNGVRTVLAIDLQSGKILDAMPSRGVNEHIDSSGDGRYYAFGIYGGHLFIRDVKLHKTIVDWAMPLPDYCHFSRDDRRVSTVGLNALAVCLELPSGRVRMISRGAYRASVSPDGHTFGVVGTGTRVYGDTLPARDSVTIPNTWAAVYGMNSQGRLVCGTGQAVRQLDPRTLKTLTVVQGAASVASVSQDSNWRMASSADGGSDILSTFDGRRLCHLAAWNFFQFTMDVTLDGRRIADLDTSGRHVFAFDSHGRRLWNYDSSASGVNSVRWSHSGALLAVARANGDIVILDAASGKPIRRLHVSSGGSQDIAFSPDDKFVGVASQDVDVYIVPVSGAPPIIARGHGNWAGSVAFSHDGTRLLTASTDGTVRLWDARTGRQVLQFGDGKVPMFMAAFSPTDDRIFTSDFGGTVRVYRMR